MTKRIDIEKSKRWLEASFLPEFICSAQVSDHGEWIEIDIRDATGRVAVSKTKLARAAVTDPRRLSGIIRRYNELLGITRDIESVD